MKSYEMPEERNISTSDEVESEFLDLDELEKQHRRLKQQEEEIKYLKDKVEILTKFQKEGNLGHEGMMKDEGNKGLEETENSEEYQMMEFPEETYYLRLFDNKGFFWDSFKFKEVEDVHSKFEMRTLSSNPNKAYFSPLLDQKVADDLLSNPEEYLDPACSYDGDFVKGRRYEILEEGLLIKEGDLWKIALKCKILIS